VLKTARIGGTLAALFQTGTSNEGETACRRGGGRTCLFVESSFALFYTQMHGKSSSRITLPIALRVKEPKRHAVIVCQFARQGRVDLKGAKKKRGMHLAPFP
jgi:hypothetical protein